MYSTIITAPSMMMPKSMAPKLIRLASTPNKYIMASANNKLKGITEATTSPERKLPSSKTTTNTTIKQPKTRFSTMVKVVRPINSERSKKPLITTPSGRAVSISAIRAFTRSIVPFPSAPLSIITCPSTFSPCALAVMAPKRLA